MKAASRRAIPAVGKVLDALAVSELPRSLVLKVVRRHLATLRKAGDVPDFEQIVGSISDELGRLAASRLQPIINGTGIILHTNFGRAPLAPAAVEALSAIAASYNNLEFDLVSGVRGKRAGFLENSLALVCAAEAATVVNNCAAALVLIVQRFTRKNPEVVISRGELVQIGGGFRIGEILTANGARLREVGATNQTTIDDYAAALGPETGLILRVHQSNFFIGGFTSAPPDAELAQLARRRRVPFAVDLGSGALHPTESLGIREHEPTPVETLRSGADLVCFSGDKLCGGPQAGIIAGKARLVAVLKAAPLFRALRCDKLVLAALEATVDLHLRGETAQIPILARLAETRESLRPRGDEYLAQLADLPLAARLVESKAEIGGGALPRSVLPSLALELKARSCSPNELAQRLRHGRPPVVGYVANGALHLDLRTISPRQDGLVVTALRRALAHA